MPIKSKPEHNFPIKTPQIEVDDKDSIYLKTPIKK